MNRLRLRAEHGAQKFYNRRQNEPLEALAGDGAGNVEVAGRWPFVYVRLNGNGNEVDQAEYRSTIELTENTAVKVQWVKRTGLGYYTIVGFSASMLYDPATSPDSSVAKHASQHERRDWGQGGFDPLDVYVRMLEQLRAQPQATPNLTLYVTPGTYYISTYKFWPGGSSPAFTPPTTGASRTDLLYLGADDALHIVTGTVSGAGDDPIYPAVPANTIPLAFVYLTLGLTTLTEANLIEARVIWQALGGGAPLSLDLWDDDLVGLTDDDGATLQEG